MTAFLRHLLAALLLLAPVAAAAQQPALPGPPHLAWRTGAEARAIERRIDALLARMTLAEKIGQLNLRGQGDEFRMEWIDGGAHGCRDELHRADRNPTRPADRVARSRLEASRSSSASTR